MQARRGSHKLQQPTKMVALNTTTNCPRRVSFKQDDALVSVHYIPPRDNLHMQDLFYKSEDFERFRVDRNLEMERKHIRKQLHSDGFRRATRRSSVDLMMLPRAGASSSSQYGSKPCHHKEAAAVPPRTIRSGRDAAKRQGVALAA
jgi:hypothetical protein